MISPEQLASALQRLDPRDRELLAHSLRGRVPDEDLARMYGVDGTEVARRNMPSGTPTHSRANQVVVELERNSLLLRGEAKRFTRCWRSPA